MKTILTCVSLLFVLCVISHGQSVATTESVSFQATAAPSGWKVIRGKTASGDAVHAEGSVPLELATALPVDLPVEGTFRFRAALGEPIIVSALDEAPGAKSLLEFSLVLKAPTLAAMVARASGNPMATDAISTRTWSVREKPTGNLQYAWRFPFVRNLWDDRDRCEIGSDYATWVPLAEKVFALRFRLAPQSRQIWLDDRLVAEERMATPSRACFSVKLGKESRLLSARFLSSPDEGLFYPLSLTHYSQARDAATDAVAPIPSSFLKTGDGRSIPMRVPSAPFPNVSLGQSLYRYRLTQGTGPDAPYVNAMHAWTDAFRIDPATPKFRVPYRNYQTAWLLAWVDDKPNSVPKGVFRFYRPVGGYPASANFEISDDAMNKGRVTKLSQKTPDGKVLYLVKVPLDTAGLYGMRDLASQFLEFDLTKPLALGRSYPDPIYYGYHPAGLPSSIHVAGITLEEAPFSYEVKPREYAFVFEQPSKPSYTVSVTNTGDKPLQAKVTLQSKSFDGEEQKTVTGEAKIEAGKSGDVELGFDLKKLGWHELKAAVEAGGAKRECALSMVLLPPNTRTYGNAANETRFGTWDLAGHYIPGFPVNAETDPMLAMFRKIGLRRTGSDVGLMKKHNFLQKGPHTIINVVYRWKAADEEARKKIVDVELDAVGKMAQEFAEPTYFYGGEWHLGKAVQYGPNSRYTGDGQGELTEEERKNAELQIEIFTRIGKALKAKYPQAKLLLQWGAPQGTLAYLQAGISKDVVDGFGMDAPMFELLPEVSNMTGGINQLWQLRQEAKRMGWGRLPIHWCEGPFFPTNPGALTERDQMDYQVRYLLMGLAYGIDQFEAGVVPFDAGNYYGAEHYGQGVFNRIPLMNPKPAVAAIATMSSMLCGADPVGGIDTGIPTTYCMAFQRSKDKSKVFALWRIRGQVEARIKGRGIEVVITDTMGNVSNRPVKDGTVAVTIGPSPVWLTGMEQIDGFEWGKPVYETAPAKVTRPLAEMTENNWVYDGAEDKTYDHNHFAIRRIPDPNLKADFGKGEEGYADAMAITLPVEPSNRPLATRYGSLKLKKPVEIPGKARALGIWIKGNASWGRVIYQLRDAKGQLWTSIGTKDDWNCDDAHCWSYVNFEGWRYVRFPLPGNHPYDAARELETTWWGSAGGDGIVELPLKLEKIIVEARNEVPCLGEMKVIPERSYKLSRLVAEYDSEADTTPSAIAQNKIRMQTPAWAGPTDNPIARLTAEGVGTGPEIREFTEPTHFYDGRRMVIHFNGAAELKYNLYLAVYPDGKGAELLKAGVKDGDLVTGFRPEKEVYLFLTAVGTDKKESKPSKIFKLITHDNFAEK
jgi:hypothetical protein